MGREGGAASGKTKVCVQACEIIIGHKSWGGRERCGNVAANATFVVSGKR